MELTPVRIECSFSSLTLQDVQELVRNIHSTASSQPVDLNLASIEAAPEHLALLFEAASKASSLHLSAFDLSQPDSCHALASALSSSQSLQLLDLVGNSLNEASLRVLAPAMAQCPSLLHIYLGFNNLGQEGLVALADAVCSASLPLQTLDLQSCNLEDAAAAPLTRLVRACPSLRHLNVANNTLREEGASALMEALPSCPALNFLGLHRSCHAPVSDKLAAALDALSALKRLECSSVHVTDELAAAMGRIPLEEIVCNSANDDSTWSLCKGLHTSTSLRYLDLSQSRITRNSVKAICNLIRSCTSLQTLLLSNTLIADDGAQEILEAVRESTDSALSKISLRNCSITTPSIVQEIEDLLSQRQSK